MSDSATINAQPQQSIFSLLISIIDKPRSTYAYLVANPRFKWVAPLILALLVLLANVWISTPYTAELAEKSTAQQITQSGISPDEVDDIMEQTARFRSPLFLGIVGSVTGAIALLVTWTAVAALLYFVALVSGGELNFGPVFVVVSWASLPITLRTLIQAILTLVTGRFPLYTGLAALFVTGDPLTDAANPMIGLLSFADIFWIWHIILLVIGLGVAAKFSWLKSFIIILLYAIISIALAVGFTFLAAANA